MITYFFTIATLIYGALALYKEWNDHKSSWLKQCAYIGYFLIGIGSLFQVYADKMEKIKTESQNQHQKEQLDVANSKLEVMSEKISELRSEIKTEALQKKLSMVERELSRTQTALAPKPKARLQFSLERLSNAEDLTENSGKMIARNPLNPDGSVDFELVVFNSHFVDANDVLLNVEICDQCKFKSIPAGYKKLETFNDRAVESRLGNIHAAMKIEPVKFSVYPPMATAKFIQIAVKYRCTTCLNNKVFSSGFVEIIQP